MGGGGGVVAFFMSVNFCVSGYMKILFNLGIENKDIKHLRTKREYYSTSVFCTPIQNLLKSVQNYEQSKIKIVHDVDEDISFSLRGRDFLFPN